MKRPTMRVHRNLFSLRNKAIPPWSYYAANSKHTQGAYSLVLDNVTIKQPSGKKFIACVENGAKRSVFTWFRGECVEMNPTGVEIPPTAERIFFNPKKQDLYFHTSDGTRVDHMSRVWLTPEGECWALGTR